MVASHNPLAADSLSSSRPPTRWRIGQSWGRTLRGRGLTLVELLVVVVILTTLVGAAIPLLSPADDARKIREGARQLNTYITAAQSKAIRTGRPYGVAFKKLSTDVIPTLPLNRAADIDNRLSDRGVCIEVFQVRRPQDFAGFSADAVAAVRPLQIGLAPVLGGVHPFTDHGALYVQLLFGRLRPRILTDPPPPNPLIFEPESLPPNVIRRGDVLEMAGFQYTICDDDFDRDGARPPDPDDLANTEGYFVGGGYVSINDPGNNQLIAKLENFVFDPTLSFAQQISPPLPPQTFLPPNNALVYFSDPRPYKIRRRPVTSSALPLQLPSGVAIDLQASGLDPGGVTHPFLHHPFADRSGNWGPNNDSTAVIMFGNDGAVTEFISDIGVVNVSHNSQQINSQQVFRNVYLLVGRRENIPVTTAPQYWQNMVGNAARTESVREEVNWLAGSSLWVTVGGRSGRVVTTENAYIDPSTSTIDPRTRQPRFRYSSPADILTSLQRQLIDAREYAISMRSQGGR